MDREDTVEFSSTIHSSAPGIFIKIDQLSGHQTEVVPQSRNVTLSDHTVIETDIQFRSVQSLSRV